MCVCTYLLGGCCCGAKERLPLFLFVLLLTCARNSGSISGMKQFIVHMKNTATTLTQLDTLIVQLDAYILGRGHSSGTHERVAPGLLLPCGQQHIVHAWTLCIHSPSMQ